MVDNTRFFFSEPTQIYRFLRTRNLIAVSNRVFITFTLDLWQANKAFNLSHFFSRSRYFCTELLLTCPTETPEQISKGKTTILKSNPEC